LYISQDIQSRTLFRVLLHGARVLKRTVDSELTTCRSRPTASNQWL